MNEAGIQTNVGKQAHKEAAAVPEATTTSQEQHPNQSAYGGVAIISGKAVASLVRRARKGFSMAGTKKKRLVLKLEDDTASGDSTSVGNNSRNARSETLEGSADNGTGSVPWWKVEYQQPPPGHLGAHVVPVAESAPVSIFQQMGEVSRPNMFAKPQANEQQQQRPTLDDSPGARKRLHWSHETPERALRRARGDDVSAFASIPSLLVDSSPTQKRKIRHIHTSEPRDILDQVGPKEQKRFQESRLVQPLHEIEITGDAPTEKAEAAPQASEPSDNNDSPRQSDRS